MWGVEDRARSFVRNNAKFKEISSMIFNQLAPGGKMRASDAAAASDLLFSQLDSHLQGLAIPVAKLSPDEVMALFTEADADHSSLLDEKEFQSFYAQVVIFAATRAAKGFAASYGVGIAVGFVSVVVVKRTLRAIPLVGLVTGPLLGLVPTVLAGPALGVAATYAIRKVGLKALKERLFKSKSEGAPQFKKG